MTTFNDCGCCEGLTVETPAAVTNRPGLSAVAYRAGTHARFKASMLSRLSSNDFPRLDKLETRDDDDFTIALVDAWALAADILTFYQERIANESYLGTATERASIVHLARLIGYELRPGVAASALLAFTLESGAGAPAAVTLERGLKVQSVPGPGEKPQTFETVETIDTRPEWNELKPRLTELHLPEAKDTEMVLAGVGTNLKAGDAIVIVGEEREKDPANGDWEFRRLASVSVDGANGRTVVRWIEPLAHPPKKSPRVYALRLHASLFGYNAQPFKTLPISLRVGDRNPNPNDTANPVIEGAFAKETTWADTALSSNTINLDAVYPQVVRDSWLVMTGPSDAVELYRVTKVEEVALAKFNLSGKSTQLTLSGENKFAPTTATVFAQSEELALAETPLRTVVSGGEIELDRVVPDLPAGRTLILSGKARPLPPAVLAFPGTKGNTTASTTATFSFGVAAPEAAAEPAIEVVHVKETFVSGGRTVLRLVESVKAYERPTVSILANVALSTHGDSVANEVLGSGDAGRPYQRFTLRQSPLTYVQAPTVSGGESTLEVRVNDLKWTEVPALFGRGPRERVYVTRIDDDGTTAVQFGNGETGARLPAGRENVAANYRKGIGLEGQVRAQQLTLLMTRPLGLKSVVNPMAAAGAQDRQSLAEARANAPLTVLTIDRIVSLRDYEDFARSFSGIAKAHATWIWTGHGRRVFITVAGIAGAQVPDRSATQKNLLAAMQKVADVFVPVTVKSYRGVSFRVTAAVKIDPALLAKNVMAAVETALRTRFSFDARAFGQAVTLSEVIAVMQNVAGVVAIDVNTLHRTTAPPARQTFLAADAPLEGAPASASPAELLTLGSLELTVMP
ncbi:MAG TPA: putative baseplate assembly protein [Thermoanaerobaculia bacterium]|jgi:predicted phage baseplate assembly protein